MTDTFADEVTATLLERRRQGLCAEPVSMRGALAEDDQGVFAVVDVLLTGDAAICTLLTVWSTIRL